MLEGKRSIDRLFTGVPLSEPLSVFKDSIEIIMGLIEDKEESKHTSKSIIDMVKKFEAGVILTEEIGVLSDSQRREFILQYSLEKLQSHQSQLETLMPMSFVYMVAVWDAFILDTARRILMVHPQLISESADMVEVSKSNMWNFSTTEEIREYLIESEVRKLDFRRMKIVRSFKEYWGIDWEKSRVPLSKVIEIRARRDVWVHNRGVINQQYVAMVGTSVSHKLRKLAEITPQYLLISLTTMVRLATYIHKIAYEKHYSKAKQ